ncbi:SAM hydrolase/SAM-dependent halogenase family protein [Aurantibacillus circumpalustris]|uniref:SAM hydrolase/SAM-dependent halogenase family protein n=1 Tax=Aurantibacillus circumpalustris TaxID=3036359 RepID=UPI00295BBA94|nr:SAM-dependent chlorinase/fluorinase [Aurantibacillus circumpalustris]
MSIITLTTDLGYRDPYLAIVKAKIIGSNLTHHIIDLSCDIKENNISDAAFIIKNSLPHFPDDSIHLVAVKFIMDRSSNNKTSNADNSRYLVTRYNNQFIICPDTGLFTLLDANFKEPVYQLYYEGANKHHFFLKDVFVDAAIHLLQKKDILDIAVLIDDYYKAFQFESFVNGNILRGKGIYVDDFGNIITNITQEKFSEVVGKRDFSITLPGARITKINTTYDEVKYGNPLVLFNSFGYMEVAANGKSAFNMLCPRDIGTTFDFNLIIEFYD